MGKGMRNPLCMQGQVSSLSNLLFCSYRFRGVRRRRLGCQIESKTAFFEDSGHLGTRVGGTIPGAQRFKETVSRALSPRHFSSVTTPPMLFLLKSF